jgi:apolipoprotein N-acyltransferase
MLASAALQVVIFPLPGLYWLLGLRWRRCWWRSAGARPGDSAIGRSGSFAARHAVAGISAGLLCGILWFAGTCYWIFDTMHRYGGLPVPAALLALILVLHVCRALSRNVRAAAGAGRGTTLGSKPAGSKPAASPASIRRALAAAPFLWVAVELARTRITAFPWELLGYAQTGILRSRGLRHFTGVYGLSFEIVLVNSVFAAAFLAPKERRKWLLAGGLCGDRDPAGGAVAGASCLSPRITPRSWCSRIFRFRRGRCGRRIFSGHAARFDCGEFASGGRKGGTTALRFDRVAGVAFAVLHERSSVSRCGERAGAAVGNWVVAGSIGITPAMHSGGESSQIFNSAALVNPQGEWVGRYDKVHLVPFGEYLPFPKVFAFAGGLTKEVGEFQHGVSRTPLDAGGERLGIFICYESIFPDEVRQGPLQGAQVLVNISNDGWYGDSGAWKQHLQQTQMRAIENGRWLLAATNTGMTASIDPYGRIVAATRASSARRWRRLMR